MPPNPHVLLLGGHGKVSLLLTPLLLSRSWRLTSLIRDPAQKPDILAAGNNSPNLSVLIESLESKKSESDAAAVLEEVKPDYIIWSAGAGGKGGPSRTNDIDRDAARYFISAAANSSFVQKFLMVSAISIRRKRAGWWSEEDWGKVERMNRDVIPAYYKAKLAADELLTVLGERKKAFQYIILRPGGLTDGLATWKVALGRTRGYGQVSALILGRCLFPRCYSSPLLFAVLFLIPIRIVVPSLRYRYSFSHRCSISLFYYSFCYFSFYYCSFSCNCSYSPCYSLFSEMHCIVGLWQPCSNYTLKHVG
jgi:NAD(P)H-binding